jgi:hypothetical protein
MPDASGSFLILLGGLVLLLFSFAKSLLPLLLGSAALPDAWLLVRKLVSARVQMCVGVYLCACYAAHTLPETLNSFVIRS